MCRQITIVLSGQSRRQKSKTKCPGISLCAGSKKICPTAFPDSNPAKATPSDPCHLDCYLQRERLCCLLAIGSLQHDPPAVSTFRLSGPDFTLSCSP